MWGFFLFLDQIKKIFDLKSPFLYTLKNYETVILKFKWLEKFKHTPKK